MYTVILFAKILPQHVEDYVTNMRICAEATNKEEGCIRYEVMQDNADPSMMCLFQVFADEAAYQVHQDTEHHRVWAAMSAGWRDPSVRTRHEMTYITPLSA
ncbi:MAG TPA: putative quinol monooxygenase [Dehalococcoidia bacterium]|jgi:quinol monooxygenase YgiN|nr:putative quinol monooxygenase [Dehalococcoidia bacterium]